MGKKKKELSRKMKKGIILTSLAMVLSTVSVIYTIMGKYDGLGMKRVVPENDYRMNSAFTLDNRLCYEDDKYETIAGIDVSLYQGDIDWEAVKADGIDFAIIRLGYRDAEHGSLHLDAYFKDNLKAAKKAGVDVGVYFFSQAVNTDEAIEEARFVVRHIRGKGVNYPVVFDMEPIDGADRISELTTTEKTKIADAFCQVTKRNGYTPMIYGNPQWLNHHIDLSYLTQYDFWLAHYALNTDYPYTFKMWQYSDQGSVAGIDGPVDMNIYFIEKD